MAFIKFVKLPKHRRYQYNPRFWDPEKEEREKRLRMLEGKASANPEDVKSRIADGFRRGYISDKSSLSAQTRRSNRLLLGIFIVLLLASYKILTMAMPGLMKWLSN